MKRKLPQMFVGSSNESKEYLDVIEESLKDLVEIKRWDKNVFDPSLGNYLENIIEAIETSNCALFLFSPDDSRTKRLEMSFVPRDNVIFETGIAIGILGKQKVFILKKEKTILPTDLDGLSVFLFKGDNDQQKNKYLKLVLKNVRDKIEKLEGLLNKSPVTLMEDISIKISEGVKTAKTIWAISPIHSSFLDIYESEIYKRLSDTNNPLHKIIIVLRDPWGNTVNLIATHSLRYSESFAVFKKITASITTLQKIRYLYPEKIEIRIIDHPFISSIYVFDPETTNCNICIQYNPLGEVLRLPKLHISSNKQFWNNLFIEQAKEYIIKSKVYPATYFIKTFEYGDFDFEEKGIVLKLWKIGYQKRGYRGDESAIEILKQDSMLILAKDQSKLVGFSVINIKTGKRRATVVDPKYRMRGIASDMVRLSLLKILKQYSEVNYQSIQMQSLLEHNGFKKVNKKSEVIKKFPYSIFKFRFDESTDSLQYKRKKTILNNKDGLSDWTILYEFNN